jgi:hypothetical protein
MVPGIHPERVDPGLAVKPLHCGSRVAVLEGGLEAAGVNALLLEVCKDLLLHGGICQVRTPVTGRSCHRRPVGLEIVLHPGFCCYCITVLEGGLETAGVNALLLEVCKDLLLHGGICQVKRVVHEWCMPLPGVARVLCGRSICSTGHAYAQRDGAEHDKCSIVNTGYFHDEIHLSSAVPAFFAMLAQ